MSRHSKRGNKKQSKTLKFIEDKKKEIQAKLSKSTTRVALLGKSGAGLEERRAIALELEEKGISAIVPEDLPAETPPDVMEKFILAGEDIDLVFVNPTSWGSVNEFGQLAEKPDIARKLRVLVERKYHPVYGVPKGYLSSAYMTHEAIYGNVYICSDALDSKEREPDWIPSSKQIILKIAERYQQWKALSSK